jgi:hypothetical protein
MHLIQAASVLALPSTTLRQHPEGVDSLLEQVDQVGIYSACVGCPNTDALLFRSSLVVSKGFARLKMG